MAKHETIDIEYLAKAMRRSIYNAYSNTLIGNAPPRVVGAFERMKAPQVGDLVIEASTVYGMRHTNHSELDGIGVLESIAQEKVAFSDPEFVWDEDVEGCPHPTEKVYYIRTFDGRLFRWVNASIIAAETELRIS